MEKNKLEQKGTDWTWRDVTAKELQAIQLRFDGISSAQIAEATGFKPGYVRKLFMQGGRLRQTYDDFALYHKSGMKEAADLVIQRSKVEAPKAIERMVALSQDVEQGAVCYKANEYLLNQAGLSTETSLRGLLKGLSQESATEKVNQVFTELYGQPIQPNIKISISAFDKSEEE